MEKYISKIEKEFDAVYSGITYPFDSKENQAVEAERKVFKSFLKQSFIKYLQSECERLEEVLQKEYPGTHINYAEDNFYAGGAQAISDQITHLQAQIKELEG